MAERVRVQSSDEGFMLRALALARRGSGYVVPNPLVGAVVVKDGKIIGEGWHERAGSNHAEVNALVSAGAAAEGGTMYVTLEPCNHHGKTPPCTEAILRAGIQRVVIALRDPNPLVKGGGAERLREAGIEVLEGVLEEQSRELNVGWLHWQKTGTPFVLLKLAVSLDGKIATRVGDSRWISSGASRQHVHRLRRHVDAVMVGANTAAIDNPRLTNRTGIGTQPLRVIVDPDLRVPATANVYRPLALNEDGPSPIAIVATTSRGSYAARRNLELAGVEVVVFDSETGSVDLRALLAHLGQKGVQTVLCEGGAALGTGLIENRLCHRLLLYQGPILIGDGGRPFFLGTQAEYVVEVPRFKLLWSKRVSTDIASLYQLKEE